MKTCFLELFYKEYIIELYFYYVRTIDFMVQLKYNLASQTYTHK